MKAKSETIQLSEITLDERLQNRSDGVCPDTVEEYAEILDELPPAKIVSDGETNWLTEGWHRYYAHEKAGKKEMPCEVKKGDFFDAFIDALSANSDHGRRRTKKDKRKAVQSAIALNEKEKRGWSNRQIASFCKVSRQLVDLMINETCQVESGHIAKKDHDGRGLTDEEKELSAAYLRDRGPCPKHPDDYLESPEREPGCDDPDIPELFDQADQPLPAQAYDAFNQLPELGKLCRDLDAMAREVERIGKLPVGRRCHWNSAVASIRAARKTMHAGRPAYVCPYCRGEKSDCRACEGQGWVTASTYDQAPPEMKEIQRKGKEGAA